MGRPRARLEEVVRAMILMLRMGCPWRDIPPEFGNWNSIFKSLFEKL